MTLARARRSGLRLALVLLSLGLAAVAVELWVRFADPFGVSYYRDANRYFNEAIRFAPDIHPESRIFEHRPDLVFACARFELATDARGLRTGHAATQAEAFRVLFLGDSVTLGWGVSDEHTWVRRLEHLVRAPDGRPLACANAGHLQYNSLQEADWLAAHAAEVAPDAVVLTFVSNDLDDAYTVYAELMAALAAQDQAPPGASARLRGTLRGWFRGLALLQHFARERTKATPVEELGIGRVEDVPGYAAGWERCARGLARVRDLCAGLGVPLVILDHSAPPVPALRDWCAAHGVPVYDFTFSTDEWRRPIRNSLADSHANALGNELLAEKARAALVHAGIAVPWDPKAAD